MFKISPIRYHYYHWRLGRGGVDQWPPEVLSVGHHISLSIDCSNQRKLLVLRLSVEIAGIRGQLNTHGSRLAVLDHYLNAHSAIKTVISPYKWTNDL